METKKDTEINEGTTMSDELQDATNIEEKTSETPQGDAVHAEEGEDTVDLLTEANEKIAQLEDKYLRQVAEFDNYRKRTMKEKAELILNGGEKTITILLPVLDDMERALKNMDTTDDVEALKEGLMLIFQKMNKVLATEGLKKIETENVAFNTDYHEAIALIPAPSDDKKGMIIDCVQTGYMLNEKVIRHAKVAVGQ